MYKPTIIALCSWLLLTGMEVEIIEQDGRSVVISTDLSLIMQSLIKAIRKGTLQKDICSDPIKITIPFSKSEKPFIVVSLPSFCDLIKQLHRNSNNYSISTSDRTKFKIFEKCKDLPLSILTHEEEYLEKLKRLKKVLLEAYNDPDLKHFIHKSKLKKADHVLRKRTKNIEHIKSEANRIHQINRTHSDSSLELQEEKEEEKLANLYEHIRCNHVTRIVTNRCHYINSLSDPINPLTDITYTPIYLKKLIADLKEQEDLISRLRAGLSLQENNTNSIDLRSAGIIPFFSGTQ
jgi:hypothetical protein